MNLRERWHAARIAAAGEEGRLAPAAAAIVAVRQAKNVDVPTLARQMGLNKATIYKLETGAGRITPAVLELVAVALELTPYESDRLFVAAGELPSWVHRLYRRAPDLVLAALREVRRELEDEGADSLMTENDW